MEQFGDSEKLDVVVSVSGKSWHDFENHDTVFGSYCYIVLCSSLTVGAIWAIVARLCLNLKHGKSTLRASLMMSHLLNKDLVLLRTPIRDKKIDT